MSPQQTRSPSPPPAVLPADSGVACQPAQLLVMAGGLAAGRGERTGGWQVGYCCTARTSSIGGRWRLCRLPAAEPLQPSKQAPLPLPLCCIPHHQRPTATLLTSSSPAVTPTPSCTPWLPCTTCPPLLNHMHAQLTIDSLSVHALASCT
jgi:hypothetical protein